MNEITITRASGRYTATIKDGKKETSDPEYPNEWRYCPLTGKPVCTAFIKEILKSPVEIPDPDQIRF